MKRRILGSPSRYCPKATPQITSTVTTIANRAFFGCTLLSNLTILDSQDYEISIGESAFEGTALAGTLTIPAKVRAIGAGAFEGIRITSLVIEEGNYLETIGDSAFRECVSLETVTIPGNVKSINANAFRNCITLRTLNLSEGLQAIKGTVNNVNGAFAGCIALESVTIPGTVTSIGNRAFYGCTGLSDIRIKAPEGTVSIGTEAFKNCPGAPYYI